MRIISTLMLAVVFTALSWSAAFAADHGARFAKYQNEIKNKDSGIYEDGENLYFHVRLPLKKGANDRRIRYKAVFQANDLLRKWAIDFASQKRNASEWEAPGVAFAANILDAGNPLWKFMEWNVKFPGQEFTGEDKDYLWLGQCGRKSDIVKQIPLSFFKKPGKELVLKNLKTMLPEMLKNNSERTLTLCSAVDLLPSGKFSKEVQEERQKIDKQIKTFLESSEFSKQIKTQLKKIQNLRFDESQSLIQDGEVKSEVQKSCLVKTNVLARVTVTTNIIVRAQAEREKALGISKDGNVTETMSTFDEKEIIETRTVKAIEIRRYVLRKKQVSVVGNPLAQEVFLSGGRMLNKPSPRTVLGEKAVKTFFENGVSFEAKEKILNEAVSENPGDCELWNLYGRCLFLKEETLAALICFRCAASLDKNNEYVLTNLAMTYNKLGRVNLGYGYATLIAGTCKNDWCIRQAESILSLKKETH